VVNRSLVANFAAAPSIAASQPGGALILAWSTNFPGYTLQQTSDLSQTNWVAAAEPAVPNGPHYQATIQTTNGPRFFRLKR
jgi:predicted TIM-barrel fold metal-dependent hydrolase